MKNRCSFVICFYLNYLNYSQNTFTPLPTTPSPVNQTPSTSQPDLHFSNNSSASLNDSRNNFLDQRPYRTVQDLPQSRNSPSNYLPSGYISQNLPSSNYVSSLPGQNTERSSPTRSTGRVRNRVSNFINSEISVYVGCFPIMPRIGYGVSCLEPGFSFHSCNEKIECTFIIEIDLSASRNV